MICVVFIFWLYMYVYQIDSTPIFFISVHKIIDEKFKFSTHYILL